MFRVNPDMSKFSGFSVMKNYGYVLALALYGKFSTMVYYLRYADFPICICLLLSPSYAVLLSG